MPTRPPLPPSLLHSLSGNLVPPGQGPLAEPSRRREVGFCAVKRVNRMMVVYGFVLQGAGLCVWDYVMADGRPISLWMLPARPHPAPQGKRWGRVASHQRHIRPYSVNRRVIADAWGCVSVTKADPETWHEDEGVLRHWVHHVRLLLARCGSNYSALLCSKSALKARSPTCSDATNLPAPSSHQSQKAHFARLTGKLMRSVSVYLHAIWEKMWTGLNAGGVHSHRLVLPTEECQATAWFIPLVRWNRKHMDCKILIWGQRR